jgi:hypothetical protein
MFRTSPIQSAQTNDAFAFIYQDEVFPVREEVLPLHGPNFEAAWDGNSPSGRLTIDLTLSRSSVLVFVNYLNALSLTSNPLSPPTVFDVLTLASVWKISTLQALCETFIDQHISDLVAPTCEFLRSTSGDRSRIESILRRHLPSFATKRALRTLPIDCLSRILVFPTNSDSSFSELFDLAVDCYREQGPAAAILFRGLDLRQLSGPRLRTMTSLPDFSWSLVADSLWGTTKGLLEDNAELRIQIAALEKAHSTRLAAVESELRTLKIELNALKASMTRKVDLESYSADLAALNQLNTATKSDLDNLKSETKRELDVVKRDCARQSELVETQSQIRSMLADAAAFRKTIDSLSLELATLKGNLETIRGNCATKTDLQSLRNSSATKSELETLRSNCASKQDLDSVKSETARSAELSELRLQLQSLSGQMATVKTDFALKQPLVRLVRWVARLHDVSEDWFLHELGIAV